MRHHQDAHYLPDNNLIENDIRPKAIGRMNYLFCKNGDATEYAAIIYSKMKCYKAARINFQNGSTTSQRTYIAKQQ